MLALLRRTSMVYISFINTHITNYNLSHVGPLWAASMYCVYTCLSDLWVLFMLVLLVQCLLESQMVHFSCLQACPAAWRTIKFFAPSLLSGHLCLNCCYQREWRMNLKFNILYNLSKFFKLGFSKILSLSNW